MNKAIFNLKKMGFFSRWAGREVVCLNLSNDDLKIAHGKVSPAKGGEIVNVSSVSIQGLPELEISGLIRAAFDKLNILAPQVICVVSTHITITKNTEIPSQDLQEIKEIIDLQAGRHTPYSREEIIADYINLGGYKKNYTRILLVIITLDIIKKQLRILEGAGFNTENIFFAPEGMTQVCTKVLKAGLKNSVAALLHLDKTVTDFVVISNGKTIFTRSIPVGAEHLMAEKEEAGLKFGEEAVRSLEAYQSEDIDRYPEEMVLTGALEDMEPLRELLNAKLHISIRCFPYLKHLSVSAQAREQISAVPGLSFFDVIAPLVSTARIDANLVPEEIKLKKAFEERSRVLVKMGILIMTLLALTWGILVSKLYFKNSFLIELKNKYYFQNQEARDHEMIFSKIQAVKYYLTDRSLSLDTLSELYALIPEDVKLTSIKLGRQEKFSIEGNAQSMATVFSIISRMEESVYFKNVEAKKTTKKKEGEEELVDFEITCVLGRDKK